MQTPPAYTIAAETRSDSIRKPSFFIIGAPKAGTTSLYAYLSTHPNIFLPRLKEPFYFCSDFPKLREQSTYISDAAKYLKLFASATNGHLACGEGSTLYLLSRVAVPEILEFNPQARFIVMLRNPVDLVHAFHAQLVRGQHEPITDFEQAWRLQDTRANGQHVPNGCIDAPVYRYRNVGMLGEQMGRLFKHVPQDRVKVLMLDELAANPKRVYEDVLKFLGVPSDHRSDFPKENANQIDRLPRLARFLRNPPFPLNTLRHQYQMRVGVHTWPARVIARLNKKHVARVPLRAGFRRELEAEFQDDILHLQQLISRDLSCWIGRRARPVPTKRAAG